MNSTLRDDLLEELSLLEKAGQHSVTTASLRKYLEASEDENALTLERKAAAGTLRYQHDMEVWKQQSSYAIAAELAMFKSVDDAGSTALKAAMTANGGAAIALLAFLGNALAKQDTGILPPHLTGVSLAMMIFFLGAGLACVAYGFRYLTQLTYSHERVTVGHALNVFSILLAALSLGCFFGGGWSAYQSFS